MHPQYFIWISIMNNIFLNFIYFLLIFPFASVGSQITININANVIERSCVISSDFNDLPVKLESGNLKGQLIGYPFVETPFSIKLEDCSDNISSARIKFIGENDNTMNNLLKNLNETELRAKGVAIGIYDKNKKNIDIQSNETSLTIDHNINSNLFQFYAFYVKTSNIVSAGKITSVANFELSYD